MTGTSKGGRYETGSVQLNTCKHAHPGTKEVSN
jgi:hypothetical protein